MSSASVAMSALHRALDVPPEPGIALGNWRWTVRQRMADVRDVLIRESEHPDDAWLAARGTAALRERTALIARMGELGPQVLESPDVTEVRQALLRLLGDIDRHLQRLRDLAYDDVEMEFGGSE
ncbi:hypothetical protein [Nocardioides sediminis]|uniref:hypothetical protein n=1 Tax=Nocardioides sediminis TaxID=433648 RepID=UPI000D2FCCEB|nr:hypothetical protein [Nocardioides sediminis]